MSDDERVAPFEVVLDTTLKRVTLVSGKGALGTWRSQAGQRRGSEEPAFADEPEGKREMSGVYASQRLSFLMFRKALRGKPGSERYSGNPTVADRRGACGDVDHGGIRRPPRVSKERVLVTLRLKSRAPQFYPDPGAHLVRIHAHFALASFKARFNAGASLHDSCQGRQRRLFQLHLGHTRRTEVVMVAVAGVLIGGIARGAGLQGTVVPSAA